MRRTISRAFFAASRASAAFTALERITLATSGCSSRYLESRSPTTLLTTPSASLLSSLIFVWASNFGSGSRTVTTAASPSRKSSPPGTVSLRSLKALVRLP